MQNKMFSSSAPFWSRTVRALAARRAIAAGAALAFALLLAAAPAAATTLIRKDAATLVDEAELIFIGSVVGSEYAVSKDGQLPFTFVTFQVDETLKGTTSDSRLTLRFAGGEDENSVVEIPGMPTFEAAGRHLLFVRGNGRLLSAVAGWWQGQLNFRSHPETGGELLTDAGGRILEGVVEDHWAFSTLSLTQDGGFAAKAGTGIAVLETDGVEITLPINLVSQKTGALTSAAEVVQVIRDFVSQRSSLKSYRPGVVVESATTDGVPETIISRGFQASIER